LERIYQTSEEVDSMLVTSLEREREHFREEGRQEGETRGLNKGELIGEIRATQKFLKRPVASVEELAQLTTPTLRRLLQELEQELAAMN
jgi:flagellar biosynthesis/type III secretory pathway protein FliH